MRDHGDTTSTVQQYRGSPADAPEAGPGWPPRLKTAWRPAAVRNGLDARVATGAVPPSTRSGPTSLSNRYGSVRRSGEHPMTQAAARCPHSQSAFLKLRIRAFSVTARLV